MDAPSSSAPCGARSPAERGGAAAPLPAMPAGEARLPIEYDDTSVNLATSLFVAAPGVITAGLGVELTNPSDGTSAAITLSTYVDASTGGVAVGPMVRSGGLSAGLFSATPQIGVGGVRIMPGSGVCAGLWCAGPAGVGLAAPGAFAIISGIELVAVISGMEGEEAESLPALLGALAVANLLPISKIVDALSAIRIPVGLGRAGGELKTIEGLGEYRQGIRYMQGFGARLDAIKGIKATIASRQDPFVEADLRALLDEALVQQALKGVAQPAPIEANIRASVEALEGFATKYGAWLDAGEGPAPDEATIDGYMAHALYLAQKLSFRAEVVERGGRRALKIRESAPFKIRDADLAVRYIETLARCFAALARDSGLAQHVAAETARRSRALADALKAFSRMAPGKRDPTALFEAHARRAWHQGWMDSMGLLYVRGPFAARLGHVRWIASNEKWGGGTALTRRLSSIEAMMPSGAEVASALAELSHEGAFGSSEIERIGICLEMLGFARSIAGRLSGGEGDARLLFSQEMAKGSAMRPTLSDGFHLLAMARDAARAARAASSLHAGALAAVAEEGQARLVRAMDDDPAATLHELHRYIERHEDSIGRIKGHLVRRIERAGKGIDGLDIEGLARIASPALTPFVGAIEQNARELLDQLVRLHERASLMPTSFEGKGEGDVMKVLASDRAAIAAALHLWNERVVIAYQGLRGRLEEAGAAGTDDVKKALKKWDEAVARIGADMAWAAADFARLNSKRVGAFFMASLAPTEPAAKAAGSGWSPAMRSGRKGSSLDNIHFGQAAGSGS